MDDGFYYEICLWADPAAVAAVDLLKDVLIGIGYRADEIAESCADGTVRVSVFEADPDTARRVFAQLRVLGRGTVEVELRGLAPEDWRDKWKRDFIPFRLTDDIDVVPAWHRDTYSSDGRVKIFIDTTLAFGTGLHETTRFMAELIATRRGRIMRFLDIGTGTGILSMVARTYGARVLWGLDIDPHSVATAQQNLGVNGMAFDWIEARDFRTFAPGPTFDYVAANIITDELIAMRDRIAAVVTPGGALALSGISLAKHDRVRAAYDPLGWLLVDEKKGEHWTALLYERPSCAGG